MKKKGLIGFDTDVFSLTLLRIDSDQVVGRCGRGGRHVHVSHKALEGPRIVHVKAAGGHLNK